MDGRLVGRAVGDVEGLTLGENEGAVGLLVGMHVGRKDGVEEGLKVGDTDGAADGRLVGLTDGIFVGVVVGLTDGEAVGRLGTRVGRELGTIVG